MNEFVEQLARSWVRLYTLGLPPDARADRQAEIASDLWEHRHDPAAAGSAGLATAVLRRILAGVPNDVLWSVEARGSTSEAPWIDPPWRSQRGLQTTITWGASAVVVALSLTAFTGIPVIAFVVLGVGGVPLLAGLMRAMLGNPSEPTSVSLGEDQMDVDTYRGRRVRLLVVLGACIAIELALWAYAVTLDDWGAARTVMFTIGGLVFPVVALGVLVLLVADLLRMRRA